jgi:hypothetical protein
MADIIDFTQMKNKRKQVAANNNQKKKTSKVDNAQTQFTGYKCSTGYITWLEFITPPAYLIKIIDDEGPDNDPDGGGPTKAKRWFNDNDFTPMVA